MPFAGCVCAAGKESDLSVLSAFVRFASVVDISVSGASTVVINAALPVGLQAQHANAAKLGNNIKR